MFLVSFLNVSWVIVPSRRVRVLASLDTVNRCRARKWVKLSPFSIMGVYMERGNHFLSDTGAVIFGGFVRFDVLVFDASTRYTMGDNRLISVF